MTREEKIAELINIRDNFNYTLAPREVFDDAIEALLKEPKTGHWIGRDTSGTNFYGKCSCCGQEIQIDAWYTQNMNYCPNCGAKMFEPQESEDKK